MIADILRLDRIAVCVVDIRRRRSRVADLCIAVGALELDFDRSRRRAIDRRERRVCSNDILFRDCVRRDFRLAIHDRDVVVVQRIECRFRSIREGQRVVVTDSLRPLASRRAVKCSFVVVVDFAKACCQRLFRIAVDQALARLGAVRIVVVRLFERRTIDRLCVADIDCQGCLIDFKVARSINDCIVDARAILEADTCHINGIRIRVLVGISRRAAVLVLSIAAASLDGKSTGAIVERISIFFDKSLTRYATLRACELCGKGPVLDGFVAIRLVATTLDVDLSSEDLDGATVFRGGICIAACLTFGRQVVVVRSSGDVVNRVIVIRCFFRTARTRRCLFPASAREPAAAIVVVTYCAFVKGIRVLVDIMLYVILSDKRRIGRSRDIGIRQRLAIDFRHIVSRDIDRRLHLEDVLVRILRPSIRVEAVAALRAGVPTSCRFAVEVRAERIAVWRCGVDFPVAAFAGRDGVLCRSLVLERAICTACVDDNGIVFRRSGVQRTIVMLAAQYDNAICARRGQIDLVVSRDAIDMDIASRLDVDAVIDGGNAIAYGDICSMD